MEGKKEKEKGKTQDGLYKYICRFLPLHIRSCIRQQKSSKKKDLVKASKLARLLGMTHPE